MNLLHSFRRMAAFVLMCVFMTSLPVAAQQANDDLSWQNVISDQVMAFQAGDATKAFSFAGAGFQRSYSDPERFVSDIKRGGYAPIFESQSHSFGKHVREGDLVHQVVTFYGSDQMLREALYTLGAEEGEWRVYGVILKPVSGLGV